MVRGEIFRLRSPRDQRGHEQSGARFGVVVQSDELLALSTVLVAPTSTTQRAATFRPEVELAGQRTRILTDQTMAVDATRLGRSAGRLSASELSALDEALRLMFAL